jgi:hypothetical protein
MVVVVLVLSMARSYLFPSPFPERKNVSFLRPFFIRKTSFSLLFTLFSVSVPFFITKKPFLCPFGDRQLQAVTGNFPVSACYLDSSVFPSLALFSIRKEQARKDTNAGKETKDIETGKRERHRKRKEKMANHYAGRASKPTRIPATKSTHASDRGRKTFHPRRISWS